MPRVVSDEQQIATAHFTANLKAYPTTVTFGWVTFPNRINDVSVVVALATLVRAPKAALPVVVSDDHSHSRNCVVAYIACLCV
jgi:hypothetical protein